MSITEEQFISEYLNRIGYHGSRIPCPDTLIELQLLHVSHVLFENLDLLGDSFTPNLDKEYLFDKIVKRHRGGVCYELNTSFYNLLTAMGFSACQISGSVQPSENLFSHVATLVHFEDGDYLADVGFGDAYLPVLKLNGTPCARYNGYDYFLKLLRENIYDIMACRPDEEPVRMYTIELTPRKMSDYFGRFTWASAKGNTAFSEYPICVMHTPNQRITLRRGKLVVVENGETVETRPVSPGEETNRILREVFHLL